MQLLHDTTLLYTLIATIAAGGIVISRGQDSRTFGPLNQGKMYPWILPALAILASSIFQFWIIMLPILPFAHPEVLIFCALSVSLLAPVVLSRNPAHIARKFRELLSSRLRTTLSMILLVFYALVQPLAFLYLADHTLSHYFMNSGYFLLVFLIVVAGICALIGGKNISTYMSMPFVLTIVVLAIGVSYFGIKIPELLAFLRFPMEEAEHFFIERNVAESNWIYGTAGFCAVSWWIWWSDKGVLVASEMSDEEANPRSTVVASIVCVGLALVLLSLRSSGIVLQTNSSMGPSLFLRQNDVFTFFLLFGLVSVFISAFVQSFQIIGRVVQAYLISAVLQREKSEKHRLAARLAISSGVLVSIFVIPFVQQSGVELVFVYLAYLACFATPLSALFVVFLIWRDRSETGMIAGFVGGLSGGIIAMTALFLERKPGQDSWLSLYEIAAGIFLVSAACTICGIYLHSSRVYLRLSSKEP